MKSLFLTGLLCLCASSILEAAQRDPHIVHAYTTLGSRVGDAGILASNQQGLHEIFVTGSSSSFGNDSDFWHALEYSAEFDTYIQVFVSGHIPGWIRKIKLADILPNPGDEIVVATFSGDLYVYNQRSKELLTVIETGYFLNDFEVFDFDGDGANELVILGGDGMYMYDSDGVQFAHFNNMSGVDLEIGQFDLDPSWEIISSNGFVLDFSSRQIQCELPAGFGNMMAATDFDNDGMNELLYVKGSSELWVFDVDTCQKKRSRSFDFIQAMLIADSNDDGIDELIIAFDDSGNEVSSMDLSTGNFNWRIRSNFFDVSSVLIADVDLDGKKEVVWGSVSSTPSSNTLYVANPRTESIQWESRGIDGPFLGPLLGDVDGDGVAEVITVPEDSGFLADGAFIAMLEQDSFYAQTSDTILSGSRPEDVKLADINGDGDMEVLVVGDGYLEVYDYIPGTGFVVLHSFGVFGGEDYNAVAAADIDGDGNLELLVAVRSLFVAELIAIDPISGLEEMRTLLGTTSGTNAEILVADFDADGVEEIVVLAPFASLDIFDITGTSLFLNPTDNFDAIRLGRAQPGGPIPILLSDDAGGLVKYQWDGTDLVLQVSVDFLPSIIDGFTQWANGWMFAGSEGFLHLIDVSTGEILWKSDYLDENGGDGFGKYVIELDNGDFVTGGADGIYKYRLR